MVPRRRSRLEKGAPFLALLTVLTVFLACSFGSSKKCTAALTYQGTRYLGVDAKKEKAISNACNVYCRDDDPEYDAMYRIWVDSQEGRVAGRPSKQEAIYKSSRMMDFVTITCANKCVGWTKDGTATVDVKCN